MRLSIPWGRDGSAIKSYHVSPAMHVGGQNVKNLTGKLRHGFYHLVPNIRRYWQNQGKILKQHDGKYNRRTTHKRACPRICIRYRLGID